MARDGQLRLELNDVYGNRLLERVTIHLRNMTLTDSRVIKDVSASRRLLVKDLHGAPNGLYRIEVDPPSYLPVSQFVNLKAEGVTPLVLTFPVDSKKLQRVDFPEYGKLHPDLRRLLEVSRNVVGFQGLAGEELYRMLDDIRKAGMLNIAAKSAATLLSNGNSVLKHLRELRELRGDRFFAAVPKELREETKNSVGAGLFREVDGRLHHPPEAGFSDAGSFKTLDFYGNLQLTFFLRGEECVADIDIDDASGLAHVFQVLRNFLTGRPTQPYDIHQILIAYQKLDPGYQLLV